MTIDVSHWLCTMGFATFAWLTVFFIQIAIDEGKGWGGVWVMGLIAWGFSFGVDGLHEWFQNIQIHW